MGNATGVSEAIGKKTRGKRGAGAQGFVRKLTQDAAKLQEVFNNRELFWKHEIKSLFVLGQIVKAWEVVEGLPSTTDADRALIARARAIAKELKQS